MVVEDNLVVRSGDQDDEVVSGSGEGGEMKVRKREAICEECYEHESKYRCPGCGIRSCGVQCIKSHKERTQCDGKRKRTEFVGINAFNDNWLISDYNLLEEILRQADSAKRLRAPLGRGDELTPQQKALRNQAKARSTNLLFLARGMTKRKENTTFFEKRSKRILWRVEWIFEGTEVRLIDNRVDENSSLDIVLAKHLAHDAENVSVRHRLRNFRWKPIHELLVLLPREQCPAAEKEYFELSLGDCLKNQLADKTVIEYPIIHVLLPDSLSKFAGAKISKALPPKVVELDPSEAVVIHDPQNLEGVPFREEKFQEDDNLEEGEIMA
ncbi:hypothetical protein R1sor_018593 [Riccia sorocarpa]|uniref:HIT-type domain-containing protein n=1 Tax=Riccia sorocarpa TaxID=122646 RepID=A0ABD3IE86_9MARC